ncbi:MAG: TonB-dependent receptor [Pseudomonadota bacterium]|jgi:iron complex outermembrane receptor protein
MKSSKSQLAVRSVLAVAAISFAGTVVAEEAAGQLADIVVTAQKREESMQKVPIAVTALDAAALERSYARDIQGVAQLAPNLIVDPTLGNGTASIAIRGVQLNDVEKSFDPAVAVYLDGIYLANNTGALLQISDASEVEVLRGPQGTLFGRNTIGGLINIHRALPTGELGGKVSVTYGRFDELDTVGVLNLPSALDGRFKTKVSVVRQTGGGYFKNVSASPLNGRREGDTDFTGLSWSSTLQATDTFDLGLILDYFDDKTPTRPVTSIAGPLEVFCGLLHANCGAPADDSAYHSNSHTVIAQPASLKTKAATLNAKWQASAGQRFVSVMGYRDVNENAVEEFDGASVVPGPTPVFYVQRPTTSHQFSEELRLESDWSKQLRSTVGLYYFDGSYHIHQNTYIFGAFSNSPDFSQKTTSEAAFGQVDWDLAQDWSLSLGGRYSKEKKEVCGSVTSAANPFISFGDCDLGGYQGSYVDPSTGQTVVNTGKATWSKFTPRVGLTYNIDPNKIAYLTYSEGFRSGGFNGRSTGASTLGPYQPEKLKTVELGTKTQWMENRLRLNATLFHTKYSNKQEDVVFPDPANAGSTVTLVQNAASATIQGAEFELTAIPTRGLTTSLNIGVLDAKYDQWNVVDPTNPTGPLVDKSGFKLRRAPKLTAGLNVQYEQSLSNGHALVYGANYAYKSDYYIVGNTLSPYEVAPQGAFNTNPGHIKSFGDLDASLAYDAGTWKVSVWAKNLTNERHFLHVLDVGTQYSAGANNQPEPVPFSTLWTFGTINPPRTYGVSAQLKF